MVEIPPKMKKRQITLGSALDGFEASQQSPVAASIDLAAGTYFAPSDNEMLITAAQTAGPFPSVSAPGRIRWDLVYLDETGAAQVEAGAEQITPVLDFTGAPGNGAPTAAGKVFPIAYVEVDESGAVLIVDDDITDIRAYINLAERGAVGDLATDDGTGAGGILGTNWKRSPIDHRHPPNIDGVNPAGIDTTAGPGASAIYSRRDHIHVLSVNALNQVNSPLDRAATCLWGPRDNVAAGNPNVRMWVLAQFAARAQNLPFQWFRVGPNFLIPRELLTLFPIDLFGGAGNILPGSADDTNPTAAAVANTFLYVYVIGVPDTTTYALVYSTNNPSVGPGLTNVAFTGPGYTAWRFVTCIEMSNTDGLAVAARKVGDTVIKEWPTGSILNIGNRAGHIETLLWAGVVADHTVSLAEHVSPAAFAAFINWHLQADSGLVSTTTLYVRSVAATAMGRQDQPDALAGLGSDAMKVLALSNDNTTLDQYAADGWWLPMDRLKQIRVQVGVAGGGSVAAQVVAYKEAADGRIIDYVWV